MRLFCKDAFIFEIHIGNSSILHLLQKFYARCLLFKKYIYNSNKDLTKIIIIIPAKDPVRPQFLMV